MGMVVWLRKYFFSRLRIKAAKFLELKSPKKILDVATGTGAQHMNWQKWATMFRNWFVTENACSGEKKLSPKLKLKFQEADGTKLPFKDEAFDVATISWGIHDMPYEVGIKVLKEMKRVIKKAGIILIVDYMNPRKHKVAIFTHPLISLYELKTINRYWEGIRTYIDNTELKIVKESNFLGVWEFVLWRNKMSSLICATSLK